MISKKGSAPLQKKEKKASQTPKSTAIAATPKKTSECCAGAHSCSSTGSNTSKPATFSSTQTKLFADSKKGPKTRIVVKFDVGFGNFLTIRGKGADLNWDKGIPLKNMKKDEWVWETEAAFNTGEFKILINDKHYESGENHPLKCGATVQVTPFF